MCPNRTPSKIQTSDGIHRSPRRARGHEMRPVAEFLRTNPVFSVQIANDRQSVRFVFSFPVPVQLSKLFPGEAYVLFDGDASGFRGAIKKTFDELESGKRLTLKNGTEVKPKLVKKYVVDHLRRIYFESVSEYLRYSRPDEKLKKIGEQEIEIFRSFGEVKKNQPEPGLALRVVKQFAKAHKAVQEAHKVARSLKNHPWQTTLVNLDKTLATGGVQRTIRVISKDQQFRDDKACFFGTPPKEFAERWVRDYFKSKNINLEHKLSTYSRVAKRIKNAARPVVR
jgi:hypothetical protein